MTRGVILVVFIASVTPFAYGPIPPYAQAKSSGVLKEKELEVHIGAKEKGEKELEEGVKKASDKIDQAERHLYGLFITLWVATLIIILGGGGVVFAAVYTGLRRMLQRKASTLMGHLSKEFEDGMVKKFDTAMTLSDSKRLSSHGDLYSDIGEVYPRESDHWSAFMNIAQTQYEEALGEVQKLREDHPTKKRRICSVRNNLAYLLVLRADPASRENAIEHAKYAYENASAYPDGFHWEDTYGWVQLVFARNQDERERAKSLLNALYERGELPQGWVEKRRNKLQEYLHNQ